MINSVKVKQLGLAAFIKMKGETLLRFEEGCYVFESDKSLVDWRVEYMNSCCSKHDSEVCELRKFYDSRITHK